MSLLFLFHFQQRRPLLLQFPCQINVTIIQHLFQMQHVIITIRVQVIVVDLFLHRTVRLRIPMDGIEFKALLMVQQ